MANLGLSEMLMIAILVIVFVGPDDLPKLMRMLGRNYGKLRRASDELRRAFTLEVDRVDSEARAVEIKRRRDELLARRRAEAATQGDGPVSRPLKDEKPSPDAPETDLPKADVRNGAETPEPSSAAPEPAAPKPAAPKTAAPEPAAREPSPQGEEFAAQGQEQEG